jgi:sterol desaturase/sphingolipid hydroxylase (fatty acid hydroxylase superfamily)
MVAAGFFACLLLHDAWFSRTHRWLHRSRSLRLAHGVPHASPTPTARAAMSFHPHVALTGAIVIPAPVLLVLVRVAVLVLLTLTLTMTVMGVTNQMGWKLFPRRLVHSRAGRRLITASQHQRHHKQYRANYGLSFRHCDHLCGTDRGIAAP